MSGPVHFPSVEAYFLSQVDYAPLIPALQNTSPFWTTLRENTITNEELDSYIRMDIFIDGSTSSTTKAAIAVALGRLTGQIASPE